MGVLPKLFGAKLAQAIGSQTLSNVLTDRVDSIDVVNGDLVVAPVAANKTLALGSSVYDDLRVALTSSKTGGSKDPTFAKVKDNGAGSQGVFAYSFHPTNENELYFVAQFPHSKKMGTAIKPHIHWTPATTGSAGQVVSWGLEYTWANYSGDFPNTTILFSNTHGPADSALTAGRHYITALGTISALANETPSSVLLCRMFRDAGGTLATDSYTGNAFGLYVDFHIEIDTLGSRLEFTK
jgi:hypothetical protein